MHFYQLGFYGKPCAYNEDQPWFDSAAKYLDETQVPNDWTLIFNSTQDTQSELMFNTNTFFTQPLRLIESMNDTFYMEVDIIDDNSEKFNQNRTDDYWEDVYVLNIGIGEFTRGKVGDNDEFANISSMDNAYELWIGRLGTGNIYMGGDYYSWNDSGNISSDLASIEDMDYEANPVDKITIGIGIKPGEWSVYTDTTGTWTEYKGESNSDMNLSQIDQAKIGFMLYSEVLDGTAIKEYTDHLKLVVRFRNFVHLDTAQKYYPDIEVPLGLYNLTLQGSSNYTLPVKVATKASYNVNFEIMAAPNFIMSINPVIEITSYVVDDDIYKDIAIKEIEVVQSSIHYDSNTNIISGYFTLSTGLINMFQPIPVTITMCANKMTNENYTTSVTFNIKAEN